jgi:hypothetical protein
MNKYLFTNKFTIDMSHIDGVFMIDSGKKKYPKFGVRLVMFGGKVQEELSFETKKEREKMLNMISDFKFLEEMNNKQE